MTTDRRVTGNPFDDADEFLVLADTAQRYSLWPADLAVPAGWRVALAAKTRAECLSFVNSQSHGPVPRERGLTGACVHDLVARQAERTPDALAVVGADARLTYAELNARADRVAAHLAAAGAGPGAVIGVCLPRNTDLVVTLLAVLKSGAGYAVLDSTLPGTRLAGMVGDAGITCVIAAERPAWLAEEPAFVRPDLVEGPVATPPPAADGDIACVMFTSGSTGRPKGVGAPHRAIVATLTGQDYAPFGAGAVWLQCSPGSWDAFVLELWGPLCNGGTCVLHPDGRPDPLLIAALVAAHGITVAYLSAGLFAVIVDECPSALDGVEDIIVGGEPLSPEHLARLHARTPGIRLRNGYGPVECMVFLTSHPITPADIADGSIPVGRPLAGKRYHLLDARLRPVADGQVGDVYGAGEGLADGYVGRPDLTAERFVADPSGPPGTRMYRTGDLGRRRADGTLELLGRSDDQVKVRGYRVELDEVRVAVCGHPAVSSAAVVASGEQLRELVCFYSCGTVAVAEPELRGHLAGLLPEYMIPTRLVRLGCLPLNRNGKVDRAELSRRARQELHVHDASCGRFCVGV
ncbi:amino acid adenylation domain-containing protein [Amycolatopsis mediterranei]|uniref:amino acid adenylation domain-containing protein n=1 Tax=Amycolatopsis mediterranei TaxID=33910 RepID=UPI003434D738